MASLCSSQLAKTLIRIAGGIPSRRGISTFPIMRAAPGGSSVSTGSGPKHNVFPNDPPSVNDDAGKVEPWFGDAQGGNGSNGANVGDPMGADSD